MGNLIRALITGIWAASMIGLSRGSERIEVKIGAFIILSSIALVSIYLNKNKELSKKIFRYDFSKVD
jgi:hypothetical protein